MVSLVKSMPKLKGIEKKGFLTLTNVEGGESTIRLRSGLTMINHINKIYLCQIKCVTCFVNSGYDHIKLGKI